MLDRFITPPWGGALRNYYWHIRMYGDRNQALRRRYYRRIQAEKKRLTDAGVNQELVRLYCRALANSQNREAMRRFAFYAAQMPLEFEKVL